MSGQRIKEDAEIVSLETASFKRKIRKPLKFGNYWAMEVSHQQGLNTSKHPQTNQHERLFDYKNLH
jgi:hypothetical protein